MVSIINLIKKIDEVNGKHCQPINVVIVNDQIVRLSYIDGSFHWHKHNDQDELFYLIKGKLLIQLKNQPDIVLSTGEMTVIPKCVDHYPKSIEPSFALLFEPISLKTNGD